jgi:hypothetical protein
MARLSIRLVFCAAILFCVSVLPARAQGNGPGFHASVHFDGGCPGLQIVSSATPPATVGPIPVPCISGSAMAAGEADAGTLRAAAHTAHACCGTSSAATGRARIQIDNVVLSGPGAATIPVSLNFQLRGTIASNPDFGQAGVVLYVALSGLGGTSQIYLTSSGILDQSGLFASTAVSFPTSTIDRSFTTPVVNLAPNQPFRLDLELMTFSDMAGTGSTQSDFFSGTNGFALPVGVPVFNLPEGYTVNIPELNVVDNRWQTVVPPAVSVSPAALNFGSVPVGSSSTLLATVTNTGGPGLQVTAGLAPAGAFSIVSLKKNGAAAVAPVALDTNETLDVEVAFAPLAAGGAQAALVVASNVGQVTVALTGEGVPLESPPSDQIADLLAFFDASAAAGVLQGSGPGNSGPGRLKALRNMIQAASDFIDASNLAQACQQLQDVLDRVDGAPRPPDFVTGPAVAEFRTRVTELRAALGCQ